MALFDWFKTAVSDAGAKLVTAVGDAFAKNFTTDDERLQAQAAMMRQVHEYELRVFEISAKLNESYLADIANARAMQAAALAQDDKFSKRFVYYLTIGLCLLCFAFDFALFWVNYPPQNRDMINMVAGVINSTALASIIAFFYGSSQSSADKQKQINSMLNEPASKP